MSKFKSRAPKTKEEKEWAASHNIMFLENEEGECWYALAGKMASGKTVIVYDDNGRVVAADTDATTLWPVGFHVAEVDVPDGFNQSNPAQWIYDGKGLSLYIKSDEEVLNGNKRIQQKLLADVTPEIDALKDAQEFGAATDKQVERYNELRKYRVSLLNVDLLNPEWPDKVQ